MSQPTSKPPFAVQAAKASWAAPLLATAISFFASKQIKGDSARDVAFIVLGSVGILTVSGVVLACVALYGVIKHGARGILVPAMIGLLLSSGVIFLVGTSIWHVQNQKQSQPSKAQQPNR